MATAICVAALSPCESRHDETESASAMTFYVPPGHIATAESAGPHGVETSRPAAGSCRCERGPRHGVARRARSPSPGRPHPRRGRAGALRALSSTYVERRDRLQRGGALDAAGKRAVSRCSTLRCTSWSTQAIVAACPPSSRPPREVLDVAAGREAPGRLARARRQRRSVSRSPSWAVARGDLDVSPDG